MNSAGLMLQTIQAIQEALMIVKPPPRMTTSQWADERRQLSRGSTSEFGKWRTKRAEYLREIQDALSDDRYHGDYRVEQIVFMKPSQSGGTEVMNNDIGRVIDIDPCSILMMRATVEMGEEWSKDRFMPMVEDTPVLRKKIKAARSRDSNNTITHKRFPGGSLAITGANSPASIASRPICRLYVDDVDRMEPTKEGDPTDLAIARTDTFANRKIYLNSSPRDTGTSRVAAAYEESDQRKYHVPCLKCGVFDILVWAQVRWSPDPPEDAYYQCLHCGAKHSDADIDKMVQSGKWIAEKPFRGIAGFWINAIYSPFPQVTLGKLATRWTKIKKNPTRRRTFINTVLAETWNLKGGDELDYQEIYNRREEYLADVPMGAILLMAGIDFQKDWCKIVVLAIGKDDEEWLIDSVRFDGSFERPEIWNDITGYLERTYLHENGVRMKVESAAFDTGHNAKKIYRYVKAKQAEGKRYHATKGASTYGKPFFSPKPTTSNEAKVKLYSIGTDGAKESLYARLDLKEPGPSYIHFPMKFDEAYFKELTSEALNTALMKPKWEKLPGRNRNEALDCHILAEVAFAIFNPNLEAFEKDLNYQAANIKAGGPELPRRNPHQRRIISRGIE